MPADVIATDALIVGAGPVGLFQVFQLGLLEISAQVVDSLPRAGGQCIELYPDKPIYDIPGLPVATGRELVERLMTQIRPFTTGFHLGDVVASVQPQAEGGFAVETAGGKRFSARVVVVAGGVGSFQPRRIALEELAAFEGTQVFHHDAAPADVAAQHLVIAGDDEAAVTTALRFAQDSAQRAASVTLLHRRDVFRAPPEQLAALRRLRYAGRIRAAIGQPVGVVVDQGLLAALQIAGADGTTHALPLDSLLVRLGLSPKLGPIAQWGLALERRQVVVDTEHFETSVPGIFAVGDVNTYPGKKKLILCGFHEATLAAWGAAARIFPGTQPPLQYTTTSSRLHQLLGVAGPAPGGPASD